MVSFMKLLLPAAALVVTGITVTWPQLLPDKNQLKVGSTPLMGLQIEGLVIENPRYIGTDKEQQSYQISAASASQSNRSDRFIYLTRPKADLMLSEHGRIALTARTGVYNRQVEIVELTGNVTLLTRNGFRFVSESAVIDLQESAATGRQQVRGTSSRGEVTAEGFRLKDGGRHVAFTGRSRAILPGLVRKPS